MVPSDDKVSAFQVGLIVFSSVFGSGIFLLPPSAARELKNDAWLIAVIGGLIGVLSVFLISKGKKVYSKYGLVGTNKLLFGKVLGTIFLVPYLIYFTMGGFMIRIYGETIKIFLLPKTPVEMIIIPLILLGALLIRTGIETLARFFEAMLIPIILMIVILITVVIPGSDFSNLLPAFTNNFSDYLKGALSALLVYTGSEVLSILFPYMRSPEKAFKVTRNAILLITAIHITVVIENIARLGPKQTASFIYSTFYLVKVSEIPGAFIERFDGIVMAVWAISQFSAYVSVMGLGHIFLTDLLNQKEAKHMVWVSLPPLFIMSMLGKNLSEVFSILNTTIEFVMPFTALISPLMVLAAISIRKKAGKEL